MAFRSVLGPIIACHCMARLPPGLALASIVLVGSAGCTVGTDHGSRDGSIAADGRIPIGGCDPSRDADGDGIADAAEGTGDVDLDGIPNDLDTDSDGDGASDSEENAAGGPCVLLDGDGDGVADFRDTDSDNDGLTDADERGVYATDPHSLDSDGDGVTDLGEVAAGTDPRDASSTIPPTDFFVVLPYLGDHVRRTLRFGTNIQQADVYFLIDASGSQEPVIDNVRTSLTDISTQLAREIPDLQMGVGFFQDFPFSSGSPFGPTFFGGPGDVPYGNRQDITPDLSTVASALAGITIGDGRDGNESQVEAIYQTATGMGGDWTFMGGVARYSLPPRACPSIPDEIGTRRGYPCFRPGSLPIVVLVTDYEWHNGGTDGLRWPYQDIFPAVPGLHNAASALRAIGGRYIGVAVPVGDTMSTYFRSDHEAMARMTGSVDGGGMPLVYNAFAGDVSDRIIDGVRTLVGSTPQDVTTVRENVPPNPGDVDATGFIVSITPVEGYDSAGTPGRGYTSKDATTFYGVTPGTMVDFEIDFYNEIVTPPRTAQVFRARIVVMGNGVARLSERQVYVIVPPEGGVILI
jgi:hypothetical protein